MGLGDYRFILFPIGKVPELDDGMVEFIGPNNFDFAHAVNILEKNRFIKNDTSSKSWYSFDDACYFRYDDGTYKIDILLNTGTKTDKAEEISVRTNFLNGEGNISEALHICKMLCDSLSLICWSMKLCKIVDLNDIQDLEHIKTHFKKLQNKN